MRLPAAVFLFTLLLSPAITFAWPGKVINIADADTNPWHRITTATRLANMATIRSHVFGIWITVRTIDYSYILDISGNRVFRADPDTVRYSRMFVIYDRSKPVAYEPGKDHNVADGILLKRVLP